MSNVRASWHQSVLTGDPGGAGSGPALGAHKAGVPAECNAAHKNARVEASVLSDKGALTYEYSLYECVDKPSQ